MEKGHEEQHQKHRSALRALKNMHFLSIAVNQFIELATSGIFIQEKEMQEVQKKIERRESVASVCRKKMKKAFSNNHFVSARIVKHVFLPFHLFFGNVE